MKAKFHGLTLIFLTSFLWSASCKNKALQKADDPRLADIQLPEGFHVSIFAEEVPDARSLTLGDKGTVFVGNRSGDKIFALVDEDGDGKADKKYILVQNKNMPNGVAFLNGALYFAEVDKVWRLDDIENRLSNPPEPVLVSDRFPSDKHHGWKFIAFGPDGKLYVPVGAPCNICERTDDPRYASITRMNPDGSGLEVFARGIRNTVGFDWHPETRELWFTDNGRDEMGDDIPGDEVNRAPEPGMHFGYPYCHAGNIKDPEYGKNKDCSEFTPPAVTLDAHAAALGMRFYTGSMFPPEYKNRIFIAEHGSWNRSKPIGYRLVTVFKKGNQYEKKIFAEGWLKNGKAWGRPVDVLQLKDGSLLVSDDFANVVYRITYKM